MLAIHHRKNSYSEKWIKYCSDNSINYKIVDCYSSNIMEELKECNGLMWHWPHWDIKAQLFARQLTYAVEQMGLIVFPDFNTCWHYDDKIGQKYLLEALGAPLVTTYMFYDKHIALEWAKNTQFPKVFKTRNGAGSQNVKLISNKKDAFKIINRSFNKGDPHNNKSALLKESIWKLKRNITLKSIGRVLKYAGLLGIPKVFDKNYTTERNYVYFQDFIPGCNFDYRIKVIGGRCWGFKRFVRENDFRASGSGLNDFDPTTLPIKLVELSLQLANELKLQSVAFDFVEYKNQFYLIEMSYASSMVKGQADFGYWDSDLVWHSGSFTPEYFMIEDLYYQIHSS